MSIAFVAGTTAEFIKLAPVMAELRSREVPFVVWNSEQHVHGVAETLTDLGLASPDRSLVSASRRAHVARVNQVPAWVIRFAAQAWRVREQLRADLAGGGRPIIVVHGDTFTTVLGSLLGRALGARVAHVEAGMRSGSVRAPFPEELNRRFVAKVARVHFAPTSHEVDNLRAEHTRGEIVDTGANTVVDAIRMVAAAGPSIPDLPEEFGLVTLHRFETLRDTTAFSATLRALAQASQRDRLLLVAGIRERRVIEDLGLGALFGPRFRLVDKMSYAEFMPILARAAFVVTDSGGLQQECAVLGLPCAVHRAKTESQHGLGENVVLTGNELDVLKDFLVHWKDRRRPSTLGVLHPSRIIVDTLVAQSSG